MPKIVKPKTLSAKDSYKFYVKTKKKEGEEYLPYWMYKEILSRTLKRASDLVIQGATLSLGNHLGYIKIRKIFRTFKKNVVNWGDSRKLKQEIIDKGGTPKDENHPDGEEWLIYYTQPWYLRWAWIRRNGKCLIKNQTAYEFKPTSNSSKTAGERDLDKLGNKGKLVLANELNPYLHLRYETNK